MARVESPSPRERAWLAVLLAAIAGDVDGTGYRLLFRLFTAHMSGNSVASGLSIGARDAKDALHRGFVIPIYVLGVLIGALVAEAAKRRRVRSYYAVTFALELALLLLFACWVSAAARMSSASPLRSDSDTGYFLLAALPTLAMGVQNATLRRVSKHATVRTTYVTGMLTNLAERMAAYLFWVRDRTRGRRGLRRWRRVVRVSGRQEPLRDAGVFLGIWLGYFAGAIFAGFGFDRLGAYVLTPTLCGLSAVMICDLIRPLELFGSESGSE